MMNNSFCAPRPTAIAAMALMLFACGGRFPWQLKGPASQPKLRYVETVNHGYDRNRSLVLIRRVDPPTRGNLDYAAYVANVMLNQSPDQRIRGLKGTVPPIDKLFGGVLISDTIVGSLAETPLSDEEKARPLAFSPMVDYLSRWRAERAKGLERARAAVREERWGLPPTPGLYLQEISQFYLHRPRSGSEQLWVEIEFRPWAKLFDRMPDDNGDGWPSVFAQLRPQLAGAEVSAKIANDYASRDLSPSEVLRWANELASYWYPSYNTDVLDLAGSDVWPLKSTEAPVVNSLDGLTVKPTVVIRGKPNGQAIYNVFVVDGMQARDRGGAGASSGSNAELKRVSVSPQADSVAAVLRQELAQHGGSWSAWAGKMRPLHTRLKRLLARRPPKLQALVGRDGFLFYRKSLDYVVGGDVQRQAAGKNPFKAIVGFKKYLERLNVDFLLVPIPTKAEVFADKLPGAGPAARGTVIHPYGRKFLLELSEAGVEVVDLLPSYLEARRTRNEGQKPIYQAQDTHWTSRGLRLAARLIAARIKRYPWYSELPQPAIEYQLKRVRFKHEGDLQSRLAAREQSRYKPQSLVGMQVLAPGGKLYDDEPQSPIVILGDSFTGVFERTYCMHAGISAHLAHEIGQPVDLVMSYGGGPNVRRKLLTRGEKALGAKRLLIWILAARDFYNYWEDWELLDQEKIKQNSVP